MEYRIKMPKIPNMGDLLNRDMLESVFDIKIEDVDSILQTNISGIGSHLSKLLYSERLKRRIYQILMFPYRRKEFFIWGTGFMNYSQTPDNSFMFKNVHICALRGQLSKNRVENILKRKLDVPLADGGLLVDRWAGNQEKKYEIGIIPHFKEQQSPIIDNLLNFYAGSTLIDLRQDPLEVVRHIAQCKVILSSSLHGLIAADSYHIPNKHIMLYDYGEKMHGDGFKFADYYSSYNLKDKPIRLYLGDDYPSTEDIVRSYNIDTSAVEKKKEQLYMSFPK